MFLTLLLPITLYISSIKKYKWSIFIVGILYFSILLTGCRNAYISSIVFLLAVMYSNINSIRNLFLALASILLVVIVYFFVVDYDSFASLIKTQTIKSRLYFWKVSLNIWLDNPILGVGPGQWSSYKIIHRPLSHHHPHNDFIRSLAEHGIAGFFCQIGIYITALYILIKNKSNIRNTTMQSGILFAGILSILILMNFDEAFMKINHLYLNLGLISIVAVKYGKSMVSLEYLSKIITSLSSILVMIYCMSLIYQRGIVQEYNDSIEQKEYTKAINALESIDQSIMNKIDDIPIDYTISQLNFNNLQKNKAGIQNLYSSLKTFPNDTRTNFALMEYYYKEKKFKNSFDRLLHLVSSVPCQRRLKLYVSHFIKKKDYKERAEKILKYLEKCDPK